MIQFENVTATYADDVGIFDLSFHIEKGEMVFLMGPTGAGKSTVLKTIYKDILLNDGSLYIDGQDITYMRTRKIPYYRRKIGMIFQDFRLIGDRSVFENVAEILQCDLDMELDAIPDLRAAIAYCEVNTDYVSRDLFDSILVSEEEHVDWLETQIGLIEKVGLENVKKMIPSQLSGGEQQRVSIA